MFAKHGFASVFEKYFNISNSSFFNCLNFLFALVLDWNGNSVNWCCWLYGREKWPNPFQSWILRARILCIHFGRKSTGRRQPWASSENLWLNTQTLFTIPGWPTFSFSLFDSLLIQPFLFTLIHFCGVVMSSTINLCCPVSKGAKMSLIIHHTYSVLKIEVERRVTMWPAVGFNDGRTATGGGKQSSIEEEVTQLK